jgi:hypothetical protein
MFPIHPKIPDIHRGVRTSKRLEKLAEAYADDSEVLEKIAHAKILVDAEVFEMIKKASKAGLFSRFLASRPGMLAAKTTAVGAPIAGLGYLTGSSLISKGREEAERTAEAVRNKVLQGALGVAGIGLGTYGLGRLMGAPESPMDWLKAPKQASAVNPEERIKEAIEKLATVGAIEGMLDMLSESLDTETTKLAAELRVMNHEYGIHILNELFPDA